VTDAPGAAGGKDERVASPFRSAVDDLLKLYTASAGKETPPAMIDAVAQALVLAIGSGLQVTALESIAAAQQTQGMMFYNAVERQQKASLLALEATAKAVKEILSVSAGSGLAPDAPESGDGR
jgi:hypothetical protein